MYFRSTFRNRFDYGAMLFQSSVHCEDNRDGQDLELCPDDQEESAEEQRAYEMIEASFGEDTAALFSTCIKPEYKQLADDTHKPCLYCLRSDCDSTKYSLETVVQYRIPQAGPEMDIWADCAIAEQHVLKITCEEEDYIVARMLPNDYSYHDAIKFHIYLIVPIEYAAKSLRKKAKLPE